MRLPRPRVAALASVLLPLLVLALGPPSASAITGGSVTSIDRAPWSVALAYSSARYGDDGHRRFLCGGTLIAPTIVLTAAHCVAGTPFPKLGYAQAPHVEAIVGRSVLSTAEGQAIQAVDVHYLARRGGRLTFVTGGAQGLFSKRKADYDVALVRLAEPAGVPPVLIAGPRESRTWRVGRRGVVAGWGHSSTRRRGISDQLRSISVRRRSDSACSRSTVAWRSRTKLCARGVRSGQGTCGGDSGSGLVVPVRTAAGRAHRLVGITNYGTRTSKRTKCSRGATTFARVSGDTLRRPIQRAVQRLAGVGVVGSGARR